MKKKAFTLAEILIVLTIIGVMAVMTIPSLMQNSNSQQKITLFKKGYNAVVNAYATEFAVKSSPKNSSDTEKMWNSLDNQLNVKYYVNGYTGEKLFNTQDVKQVGLISRRIIVAQDGLGYVVDSGAGDCIDKLQINENKNFASIQACIFVGVILDGNFNFANFKTCHVNEFGGDNQNLNDVKCDTLWFPVSSDGITSGNPDCTISGRIISDVNPRPASCNEG